MREQILAIIEKNSRISVKELAVILGAEEIDVANELKALEEEGIICGYHIAKNVRLQTEITLSYARCLK